MDSHDGKTTLPVAVDPRKAVATLIQREIDALTDDLYAIERPSSGDKIQIEQIEAAGKASFTILREQAEDANTEKLLTAFQKHITADRTKAPAYIKALEAVARRLKISGIEISSNAAVELPKEMRPIATFAGREEKRQQVDTVNVMLPIRRFDNLFWPEKIDGEMFALGQMRNSSPKDARDKAQEILAKLAQSADKQYKALEAQYNALKKENPKEKPEIEIPEWFKVPIKVAVPSVDGAEPVIKTLNLSGGFYSSSHRGKAFVYVSRDSWTKELLPYLKEYAAEKRKEAKIPNQDIEQFDGIIRLIGNGKQTVSWAKDLRKEALQKWEEMGYESDEIGTIRLAGKELRVKCHLNSDGTNEFFISEQSKDEFLEIVRATKVAFYRKFAETAGHLPYGPHYEAIRRLIEEDDRLRIEGGIS